MSFSYGITYPHQFYIIWETVWFGECGFLLKSLNHGPSAQHLTKFKPCNIKSKKAPPSDPPMANWLWPFMFLKHHTSNQENHKAAGTTLSSVCGADMTISAGEQWRANRSQSHQATPRHDEKQGNKLSPCTNCLLGHKQTWCTRTLTAFGTCLPKIRFLCLHPFYTAYGHFLMLRFSLSQQASAGASLTFLLPPKPEFLPICLDKAGFCIFSSIPSK